MDNVYHAKIKQRKEERKIQMNNVGIAEFKKVSYLQFLSDYSNIYNFGNSDYESEIVKNTYEKIVLPKRTTSGSAGYDFVCPFDIKLNPVESIKIPTGIRCRIDDGWVLKLYPRSSFGFKYRMQLDNTVGIIDSDYFDSDNEGHILLKITNDSKRGEILNIKSGDRFVQGIFLPYGIAKGDDANTTRNGGFGSTGK